METESFISVEGFDYSGPYSYEYVEWALANCEKIVMVCGSGVSLAAGLTPLHGPHGPLDQRFTTQNGRSIRGRELFTRNALADTDNSRTLNKILAELRTTAQEAAPTYFHQLLDDMYHRKVLHKCYTENFDGLEGKLTPAVFDRETGPTVVRMLGDNDHFSCDTCNAVFPSEQFHSTHLNGEDTVCPKCSNTPDPSERLGRRSQRKRKGKLRPCLYLLDEMDFEVMEDTPVWDEIPDVVLVVGTALKLKPVGGLVKRLAKAMHDEGRRVIYIGTDKLPKKAWADYIDVLLYVDVQEWAKRQLAARLPDSTARQPGNELMESFFVAPPKSFALSGSMRKFLKSGSPNACAICFLNNPEIVYACRVCYTGYCMQVGNARDAVNCVQLGKLAPIPGLENGTLDEMARNFLCPTCHIRGPGEIYPHLVRTAPFHAPDPPRSPRVIIFVFYITEFRSLADNMALQISHTWFERGWDCRVIAISLEDLANNMPIDLTTGGSRWTYRTYKVIVLYITHCISSDFTLQTSGAKSQPVDVFLDTTVAVMKPILDDAISKHAILLCCGHLFHSPEQTIVLQTYLTSVQPFQHLVGFLNTRLAPSLLTSMLPWVVVESLGRDESFASALVEHWMCDEMASTHTDVILLSPGTLPELYLFAPFQSRPLGRPLPSIVHTCLCPSIKKPAPSDTSKKWIVKHNIRKSAETSDGTSCVDIRVRCSRCQAQWDLDTKDFPGKLIGVGGLYYARLPYFKSLSEPGSQL